MPSASRVTCRPRSICTAGWDTCVPVKTFGKTLRNSRRADLVQHHHVGEPVVEDGVRADPHPAAVGRPVADGDEHRARSRGARRRPSRHTGSRGTAAARGRWRGCSASGPWARARCWRARCTSESKPAPRTPAYHRASPAALTCRTASIWRSMPVLTRSAAAIGSWTGRPRPRATSLPVPAAMIASGVLESAQRLTPRLTMPSPPVTASRSMPCAIAPSARSRAAAAVSSESSSTSWPAARSRWATARPRACPRFLPDVGLTTRPMRLPTRERYSADAWSSATSLHSGLSLARRRSMIVATPSAAK